MAPGELSRVASAVVVAVAMPALACVNSLDNGMTVYARTFWLDLVLWSGAALLFYRAVFPNLWGAGEGGRARSSRGAFFVVVGLCAMLLLALFWMGTPFLGLSQSRIEHCTLNTFMTNLLWVVPTTVFCVHALFFQGWGARLFGEGWKADVALVVTSMLLAAAVTVGRDQFVLPNVCVFPKHFAFWDDPGMTGY